MLNTKSGRKKTTLLITLLKLYLYSINETNNKDFTIFIIDQPENFLHPHATKDDWFNHSANMRTRKYSSILLNSFPRPSIKL